MQGEQDLGLPQRRHALPAAGKARQEGEARVLAERLDVDLLEFVVRWITDRHQPIFGHRASCFASNGHPRGMMTPRGGRANVLRAPRAGRNRMRTMS